MNETTLTPIIVHPEIRERILRGFEQNRLPHALLFYGPEGCGKDATAIWVAQLLNCQSSQAGVCGVCDACHKIARLQYPDVKFIFPTPSAANQKNSDVNNLRAEIAENPYRRTSFEGKNTFIGIDTVRELKQEARFKLYEGKKKIYIISQAEQMRPEAANALLKILEEPPDNLMLILTTSRIYRILPTIKSRCQLIPFRSLQEEQIFPLIQQYAANIDENRLRLIVRLAGYNLKNVFDFLESDVIEMRDLAVEFLRKIVRIQHSHELMILVESVVSQREREKARQMLWFLMLWFQDALYLQKFGESADLKNLDLKKNLTEFLKFAPRANFQEIVWEIETALQALDDPRNLNPILILTTLAIKINQHIK